jgi:hypothetical protein
VYDNLPEEEKKTYAHHVNQDIYEKNVIEDTRCDGEAIMSLHYLSWEILRQHETSGRFFVKSRHLNPGGARSSEFKEMLFFTKSVRNNYSQSIG